VDEVKAQIKTAVENPNTDLVVKSKTPVTKQKLNVIDLETNDLIDIDVNLADAWQTKPSLTRTRPTAYILMPTQEA
ncbi:peptidase, partial [bacterium]|nr:peptidase [bacterium]